jgi:hypothetical protein
MSIIQDILEDTINGNAHGLDYAVYAVRLPHADGYGDGLKILHQARNETQLAALIKKLGTRLW